MVASIQNEIGREATTGRTTRFVILGTQRTGTTLLRTSLSSHPSVLCRGEIFSLSRNPSNRTDSFWAYSRLNLVRRVRGVLTPKSLAEEFLEDLYSQPDYGAIGFKLMLSQARERPYVWSYLIRSGVQAVLVRRHNSLKTLVSRRSAAQSGVYHVSETLGAKGAVRSWDARGLELELGSLVSDLEQIEREQHQWKQRLLAADIPFIDVVYEHYVRNTRAENTRILEFLGVPDMPLESDLQKVNPDDLRKVIRNFEEVANVLKGKRFARCLEDYRECAA